VYKERIERQTATNRDTLRCVIDLLWRDNPPLMNTGDEDVKAKQLCGVHSLYGYKVINCDEVRQRRTCYSTWKLILQSLCWRLLWHQLALASC